MSAPRMVDQFRQTTPAQHREWWALLRQDSRYYAPERDDALLALYLTPEQLADFKEYGCFAFVSECGDVKYTYPFGHHCGGCVVPSDGRPEGVRWMLAIKLVWQAAQAGVECIAGRSGARFPLP